MADNINVDPGTGIGAVPVACDDVGGILYQTIKIATGADGAAVLISNANPVPISDAGGSITVDGTVTASGTVAATQSGTWNVGTVTPGTAATNLGKAIDTAVGSTDTGTGTLAKRVDTPAALTPANGDWVALQTDANGNLWVRLPDSQIETGKYEAFPNTVSTTTMLGTTGAVGDFLSTVTIVPETLNPGSISIKDGNGTAIVIFVGGTGSVLSLVPFTINLGYTAVNATSPGWQIVTGSGGNVHGVCGGNFT